MTSTSTATATANGGTSLVTLATIALIVFKILSTQGVSWAMWASGLPWWFVILGPLMISVGLALVMLLFVAVIGGAGYGIYKFFERRSDRKRAALRSKYGHFGRRF